MNADTQPQKNTAGMAAWVCLVIAWICFVLPIPGLGFFVGGTLNLVAFILAIVAMAKGGAMKGILQLLASIIVSPIVYFIGLAVFAGTVTTMSDTAQRQQQRQTNSASSETSEVIIISARELFSAYDANEVAADDQYKGKRLQVTGLIDDIRKDISNSAIVILKGGQTLDMVTVRGLSSESVADMKKGQQITVTCVGAGRILMSPVLNKCTVQ